MKNRRRPRHNSRRRGTGVDRYSSQTEVNPARLKLLLSCEVTFASLVKFADSRKTRGNNCYVLAVFAEDAWLDWVPELRAFLDKDELKYKYYSLERHRVVKNALLASRVARGIEQAEIFLLDRRTFLGAAIEDFINQGAEYGLDYGENDVWNKAARLVLDDSPLVSLRANDIDLISDNTPCLGRFDSNTLLRIAGGKFNDAMVLAARSHAAVEAVTSSRQRESFYSYFEPLPERVSTTFDVEHARSIPILNHFAGDLNSQSFGFNPASSRLQSFREQDTREVDQLQAADMAAGWAAEMLDSKKEVRELASVFRSVTVDGIPFRNY